MINLEKRWQKLTEELGVVSNVSVEMYAELAKKYSETHRHYHNLAHLEELFLLADEYADLIEEKTILELAIWYHDVIYSVWFPAKNEKKSADFALQNIASFQLSETQKVRLHSWIVAIKTHVLSKSHDTLTGRLFMDFDMAILAAPREKYLNYCQNIRKEYSVYPDLLYNAGRKKALQHFLATDNLFLSDIFRDKYEKQARENLQFELNEVLLS